VRILGADFSGGDFRHWGKISVPAEGYFAGTITDKRKLLYTILEAIKEFELKYGKRPSHFVVGISTPQLEYVKFRKRIIRKHEDTAITSKELSRYQQELLQEMVPLDKKEMYYEIEEFILDGQRGIVNPQGLYASNIEIVVNGVVIPLNFYNSMFSLLSELGLEIEEIVPEGIVQTFLYLSSQEKKLGIMYMNYGWGTVKVAIYRNGFLKYYRHFPSNLKSMLNLVAEIYHLDNCAGLEVLREIFLSENTGLKFQNKFSVQTIPVQDIRTLVNKNIYRLFYQIKKDLQEQEVPIHFNQGIKISGGVIIDYPEVKSIAEDVFHQPVEIINADRLGIDSEYATAVGLMKYWEHKYKHLFGTKNWIQRFKGKVVGFINKYF
jgi:cell division protein FtsA